VLRVRARSSVVLVGFAIFWVFAIPVSGVSPAADFTLEDHVFFKLFCFAIPARVAFANVAGASFAVFFLVHDSVSIGPYFDSVKHQLVLDSVNHQLAEQSQQKAPSRIPPGGLYYARGAFILWTHVLLLVRPPCVVSVEEYL